MNINDASRIRLLGKKSSHRELAIFIKKLYHGNPNNNVVGLSISEIADQLQTSRVTVSKYLKMSEILKINVTDGAIRAPAQLSKDYEQFINDEYIIKWRKIMNSRARGGKQNASADNLTRTFYGICNTLQILPRQFLIGTTDDDILENGRILMNNFIDLYKQHKAKIRYNSNWDLAFIDLQSVSYHYSKAARDFMKSYNHIYPNGESGVMSQSISIFHGKYADVKISEEIHQKIKADILLDFGLDSDEFRFYLLGIEAFPRAQALLAMPSKFSIIKSGDREIYECECYESKTSNYRNGKWTKHIFDTDLMQSIRAVEKRCDTMIETKQKTLFAAKMTKYLQKKYKQYGLTKSSRKYQNQEQSSYYLKKPFHTLRHAGAQRLLLATNWNIAYVAARGWKKTDELVESYGQMTAEQELKSIGGVKFG